MLVEVQDQSGSAFLARQSIVDSLIARGLLSRLRRTTGWVDVTVDPRRSETVFERGKGRRVYDTQLGNDATQALRQPLDRVLGRSASMQAVIRQVRRVAPTNLSVLLQGDTGTGKSFIARAIQQISERRGEPFIAVDCGAIAPTLMESELFGHARGAFTGAYQQKVGKFQLANNGTIFLDEVGNLTPDLQAKLLQFLEEKTIYPVGEVKPVFLNVRVISATNSQLADENESHFRRDLYYRLNEFEIDVPLLRERDDDILGYVGIFLDSACRELGKNILGLSLGAASALKNYSWPGNIREMRNVVKRITLMTDEPIVDMSHLPSDMLHYDPKQDMERGLESTFQDLFERALKSGYSQRDIMNNVYDIAERGLLKLALKISENNKGDAARLLGFDYSTLYRQLKKYDGLGVQRDSSVIRVDTRGRRLGA